MNPPEYQVRQCSRAHRRSKRLRLVVPVEVIAFVGESEAFREATRMLSVNANGGLLALAGSVCRGQVLRLVNQRTTEHQECRVVNVDAAEDGKWVVGVEFTRPAGNFWQIYFPPLNPRITPNSRN
ncbi:MAG TPA: hypothetical protein VMV59_08135 [Candidatus Dormibacteraeota bacterium]|nr:hypothetical protein [Candidatus Dormibacteraeota bacterium]